MRPWENNIRQVVPYVPGEQPSGKDLIKLNTNENPYPPSPLLEKALTKMTWEDFRKYPDPEAGILKKELAGYYGLQTNQVFVGVGSDDVLAMAFLTFFNSDKPVFFPEISYSFYKVWAELFKIPYETQSLNKRLELKVEDYNRENGGVIFPNPNAPTGLFFPLEGVRDILNHNQDVIVIVDEAYIDFGGMSACSLIEEYENLLVVQTFSKSRSMAGIRIGYAMGNARLIQALEQVKYSYNSYTMNMPSLVLGVEAVKDEEYFRETLSRIIVTREQAKKRLSQLGFLFPDSKANFILASHPKQCAADLYEKLRTENIYVRHFKQPVVEQYLRITIGTDREMDQLYKCLENFL